MSVVIGVDGGNSKTDLVVCDRDGSLVARLRGKGCSPDVLGVDGSVALLASMVDQAARSSRPPVDLPAECAVFLLAGVDHSERERQMSQALGPLALADDIFVSNDTFAVLSAGSRTGSGVAVVCGAGINAIGVTPEGVVGRYQALGDLSGDWGGGMTVGIAALGAAIRGQDGRGPATLLTDAVSRHFGVDLPQDVAAAIHERRWDEQVLVDLPPVVFAAASAGDAVAAGLVERLADEIAVMSLALMRRLGLDGRPTCVVLGGGMLQAAHGALTSRIVDAVRAEAPAAEVRVLDVPPVVGAVRTALQRTGMEPTVVEQAVQRLAAALAADAAAGTTP